MDRIVQKPVIVRKIHLMVAKVEQVHVDANLVIMVIDVKYVRTFRFQ